MPLHPTLLDIAIRLALTLLAGALIGLNRGESGHAAGLRTTTLVCLAASIAMIQVNLLLPLAGKATNSFVVMDLMRLPLGILSGMGFIGAGAILRKEDAIIGVTTAATLWVVTVIGLCLGGGQLGLGIAATVLTLGVLWVMKRIDLTLKRDHRAMLVIQMEGNGDLDSLLRPVFDTRGMSGSYIGGRYSASDGASEITFDIRWRSVAAVTEPSDLIAHVLHLPGVRSVRWDG